MTDASKPPVADPRDYVQDGAVLIGCSRQGREMVPEVIELRLANRHGLVTGATGTGKTVTLQVLAEGFSAAGVPVFAADIKGDLSGLAAKGDPKPHLVQRANDIGLTRYGNAKFPVTFWDILGEQRPSHPRHRRRHGRGAAVAPARADRAAGRRAQHRLPLDRRPARRRRQEHAHGRPQGPARRHRRDG